MKIKINTKAKVVETEGKVNKTDLTKVLAVLLKNPKDYKIIEVTVMSSWNDPIIFNPDIPLRIAEFTTIYNIEV